MLIFPVLSDVEPNPDHNGTIQSIDLDDGKTSDWDHVDSDQPVLFIESPHSVSSGGEKSALGTKQFCSGKYRALFAFVPSQKYYARNIPLHFVLIL